MKIKEKNKNKQGVSLMISYVLLIFITISLSIGVYIWLKDYATITEKINCKDGTSLTIENYNIERKNDNNNTLNLSIKNNGLFNVSGFLISAGNDSKKIPMQLLVAKDQVQYQKGYFDFKGFSGDQDLGPGQKQNAVFNLGDLDKLEIIQIQPYIFKKNNIDKIFCEQALIKQVILINPSLIPGLVSWWKFDGNVLDYGVGNNGKIQGNPVYISEKLNQGMKFDGIDDAVNSTLTQAKTTTCFWYKNSTASSWTHVVNSSGRYFVNGIIGTPSQYPIYINGDYVYIGKNASNFFNGSIDEVAIYSKALSDWEILQLYNSYNITS